MLDVWWWPRLGVKIHFLRGKKKLLRINGKMDGVKYNTSNMC